MSEIRLGLIGDNIRDSSAPDLHRLGGQMAGMSVSYDLLVPAERGEDFDATFRHAAEAGYRGINITLPYKERVVAKLAIDEPLVRTLAAVNTVLFEPDGPRGFNTDFSGFVAAYRNTFDGDAPGAVCQIGAGGVGKAVAFGLVELGLEELRLVDLDQPKAEALAAVLRRTRPGLRIEVATTPAQADGIVNCTPVGMVGYGGTPVDPALLRNARWVFDAVYTPLRTPLLNDAAAAGLKVLSGYELFFYQGLHAFEIFCGCALDEAAMRAALLARTGAGMR
ncbi:MAG: shikimate dehydrogenase [Alphaproteobacteria bacterium]